MGTHVAWECRSHRTRGEPSAERGSDPHDRSRGHVHRWFAVRVDVVEAVGRRRTHGGNSSFVRCAVNAITAKARRPSDTAERAVARRRRLGSVRPRAWSVRGKPFFNVIRRITHRLEAHRSRTTPPRRATPGSALVQCRVLAGVSR